MMGIDGVDADNGENGGSENSKNGEEIDPGRRASFDGNVLTNGI